MKGVPLRIALFVLCVIGYIVVFFIGNAITKNRSREFKTTNKLEPIRYELTVKDNKIDTVFIYSLK